MELPETLTTLFVQNTEYPDIFSCEELNLKVIVSDDQCYTLAGFMDDDIIISSYDWEDISSAIRKDTMGIE